MAKYILVDVYDREIVVYQYDNLADAKKDLREMYEEVCDINNIDMNDQHQSCISEDCTCAWVSVPFGDNYDWQIEEIN